MVEAIKQWKRLIPGEECWPGYILLHKALLKDGSGVSIWRTKKLGYYTVEVWNDKDEDGLPTPGGHLETFPVKRDWDKAERRYKELIEKHGGF